MTRKTIIDRSSRFLFCIYLFGITCCSDKERQHVLTPVIQIEMDPASFDPDARLPTGIKTVSLKSSNNFTFTSRQGENRKTIKQVLDGEKVLIEVFVNNIAESPSFSANVQIRSEVAFSVVLPSKYTMIYEQRPRGGSAILNPGTYEIEIMKNNN